MGGILIAWLVGEGIVTYRSLKHGAPPTPGQLAAVSGFFVLLAALGQYQPARAVATLTALGVDVAAFLQILPGTGPVHLTRTWPPQKITDPNVFLPTGSAPPGSNTLTPGGNPANTPPAISGSNKARGAPAGTPPNPGTVPGMPGTIFPPGSQNL